MSPTAGINLLMGSSYQGSASPKSTSTGLVYACLHLCRGSSQRSVVSRSHSRKQTKPMSNVDENDYTYRPCLFTPRLLHSRIYHCHDDDCACKCHADHPGPHHFYCYYHDKIVTHNWHACSHVAFEGLLTRHRQHETSSKQSTETQWSRNKPQNSQLQSQARRTGGINSNISQH